MSEAKVRDDICEKVVVGTIIQGSYFDEVAEFLSDECFTEKSYIEAYKAVSELQKEGHAINIISVVGKLASMGSTLMPADVVAMASNSDVLHLRDHALRLKELSIRRKFWDIGQMLVSAGTSEVTDIDDVRQGVSDSLNNMFVRQEGISSLLDAIRSLNEIIANNMKKGASVTGTPTGFTHMDVKGGLHVSDLVVIAGQTSNGKTSLALSIVRNALSKGAKVAFYSLEMTKEQLSARILATYSGVAATTILYSGDLQDSELSMIDKAIGRVEDYQLYFDDTSTSNIESILLSIRQMKIKYDIDGAVVDYLQILNVNARNNSMTREQMMGDTARRLKNIAKELGIWVIAISQLSRDNNNPVPNINRLRDSGQISEAADVVILVYRPELYNLPFPDEFSERETRNAALIDVAKGRNIGVFKFIVGFDQRTTNFFELDDAAPTPPIPEQTFVQEEYDAPF